MPQDTLGWGLRYPIRLDQDGGWVVTRFEEKVRESIWMILSTPRGERVMRPDFGCDIHSYVFTTLDSTSLTLVRAAVRDALVRWEPRIEVREVTVQPEAKGEARLLIEVEYVVRSTNFPANLVYPFYLESGTK
ncbi:MAG: GPW/gp25 family protein [Verrucomicrobiales bacterium]|nr:GPW/gp25 family protein [Verrucomicrobiales bacterium]